MITLLNKHMTIYDFQIKGGPTTVMITMVDSFFEFMLRTSTNHFHQLIILLLLALSEKGTE